MAHSHVIASNLARALLAGAWTESAMIDRAGQACGGRKRWMRKLVRRILDRYGNAPLRPNPPELADFIGSDPGPYCPRLGRVIWPIDDMAPAAGNPETWDVPAITSVGQLADWLGIAHGELDWFADVSRRNRKSPSGPLRHYDYCWQHGRRGKVRLIEMPKPRLKAIQRRILAEILDHIPAHDAAHGFRKGRSILSYVSPHIGRDVVIHLDLKDFFASIPAERVHAMFRTAGYPYSVARMLTGLCVGDVPEDVLRSSPMRGQPHWHETAAKFRAAHLPQGAPTSPALANLCVYRLDVRLAGLARRLNAEYTRYADDLILSGSSELGRAAKRVKSLVNLIAAEHELSVNWAKVRVMTQGVRQRAAGMILNVKPNVSRREFDTLKAILTNCARHGWRSQNRSGEPDFRAHLAGKLAHVAMINPERGQRLRALFDRIDWTA